MMLGSNGDHSFGNALGKVKLMNGRGNMVFHELEFFFRKLAGFIEHVVWDRHFADIVQQSSRR